MHTLPPSVVSAWGLASDQARPLGQGRINLTAFVHRGNGETLVLQRLNPLVFPEAEKVMANLRVVLDHLPQGPLQLVPGAHGDWMRDEEGALWRAWAYVPGARTVEGRATPSEARACAAAFGTFLAGLADLPPERLHTIIPGFHHTPSRLAAFEGAVAQAGPELDADRERIARLSHLAPQLAGLPLRIAHDDTKLNNVLLREDRDEALAVLDLDTVEPGSWAVDFGDMARSACNPAGEEAEPGQPLAPDLDTFAALAQGFLPPLAGLLTLEERERLSIAPAVIAFELGLRFLTDHLEGDRFFAVAGPGENLRRGRLQLDLAEGFLNSRFEMEARLRT